MILWMIGLFVWILPALLLAVVVIWATLWGPAPEEPSHDDLDSEVSTNVPAE